MHALYRRKQLLIPAEVQAIALFDEGLQVIHLGIDDHDVVLQHPGLDALPQLPCGERFMRGGAVLAAEGHIGPLQHKAVIHPAVILPARDFPDQVQAAGDLLLRIRQKQTALVNGQQFAAHDDTRVVHAVLLHRHHPQLTKPALRLPAPEVGLADEIGGLCRLIKANGIADPWQVYHMARFAAARVQDAQPPLVLVVLV